MKKLTQFKLFVLVVMLCISGNAYSDMWCSAGACQGGVPNRIITKPDGNIIIYPTSGNTPLTGITSCTGFGVNTNAILLSTGTGQANIYATLLAATLNNKPLFIRLPDSDVTCEVVYVKLNS